MILGALCSESTSRTLSQIYHSKMFNTHTFLIILFGSSTLAVGMSVTI